MPEPTPTETVTTSPSPVPTPAPSTTVGGTKLVNGSEVGGAGLAQTGRNLAAQAMAGGGLAALGVGLQKIAGKNPPDGPPPEDPPITG